MAIFHLHLSSLSYNPLRNWSPRSPSRRKKLAPGPVDATCTPAASAAQGWSPHHKVVVFTQYKCPNYLTLTENSLDRTQERRWFLFGLWCYLQRLPLISISTGKIWEVSPSKFLWDLVNESRDAEKESVQAPTNLKSTSTWVNLKVGYPWVSVNPLVSSSFNPSSTEVFFHICRHTEDLWHPKVASTTSSPEPLKLSAQLSLLLRPGYGDTSGWISYGDVPGCFCWQNAIQELDIWDTYACVYVCLYIYM